MSGGWMLAGLRRRPGPVIGTLVAAITAAVLTVAALSVVFSHTSAPLGRLASADVVVAGDTHLTVTTGQGENAQVQSVPLPAYRGVPASLATRLAALPGVASAVGETGFPGGTDRPGVVDLVAVKADPGVGANALADRIKAALHGGSGYTIATGAARGDLADPSVAVERTEGQSLGAAVIPMLIMTAMFTVAATTALSVNLRRGRFALLRAIGAKRGQVRRAVLTEQALIAFAGSALGFLPGTWLGSLAVRALAGHGMLPADTYTTMNPWLLLISFGGVLLVCLLSGLAAARRAARTKPAQAVRESAVEPRMLHPVRLVLGLAAAGGMVTLAVLALHQGGSGAQLAMAGPLLMCGMAAVALLGPLLVAGVALLLRPLHGFGPGARLALSSIRVLPRRTASAVIPVAMAVGLIGAIGFSNTSILHAAAVQSAQTVVADHVLDGSGLNDALLNQVRALPGVQGAVGVSSLSIQASDPDLESVGATAVAGTAPDRLLDLGVTSGSLSTLQPGQIAVASTEAASGALGVHLGEAVTVYLPDGTPYRATVSAIYSRGLSLGSLIIPEAVAAGHEGSAGYGQILVDGASGSALSALAAAHPGVHVADRQVYNAQVAENEQQNEFGNNLILGVMAVLAAVTMLNTLIVGTLERRRQLRLLSRVGATRRQLAGMFTWQALFVTVCGIGAGVAVSVCTLIAVTRGVTGSSAVSIPGAPAALIIGAVAVLTTATVMGTFRAVSRRI